MSNPLSFRMNYPFTGGVLLAINAIPDAYLLEDGPGCHIYRAMAIHGRHDWASALLSCTGYHRVQNSGVNVFSIATNYEGMLVETIRKLCSLDHAGVLFVVSMSMCGIVGTDYGRLLREARPTKPAFLIRGTSLSGDWLEGYAQTMDALASGMDLKGARAGREKVAVVGYFMDRCEGDHRGNVMELRRMIRGIGLDPVSIWLSGDTSADLRQVRHARTIISLPHGRKAAATLARRLGVKLVETELPFGLAGTQSWLRQVAAECGKKSEAEAFMETELRRLVPRLEWVVPNVFLNRGFVFVGDPHLLKGCADMEEELGLRLRAAFFTTRKPVGPGRGAAESGRFESAYAPSEEDLRARWEPLRREGVELVIGSYDVLTHLRPDCATVEFGFPSLRRHCLREEPFLGFRGYACLAQRLANALTCRARGGIS